MGPGGASLELTQGLQDTGLARERIENIQQLDQEIAKKLRALAATVQNILRIRTEREALTGKLARAQNRFLEVLEPLVGDITPAAVWWGYEEESPDD